MRRASYPSDLTDQQWAMLEPLIPPAKAGGHPRTTDMREVLNALLYLDRTGGQWRALPHDFPPWSTVWSYFRTWRNDGTWKRMLWIPFRRALPSAQEVNQRQLVNWLKSVDRFWGSYSIAVDVEFF